MVSMIKDEDIGGGVVMRRFTRAGVDLLAGHPLSREDILAMPTANRRALRDSGYIEVYPKSTVGGERFMVGLGDNKFNVIEGHVLNAEPIGRKEAEKLVNQS